MASETPAIFGGGNQDTKGKHRILVELNRLEQETKFLQVRLFLVSAYFANFLFLSINLFGKLFSRLSSFVLSMDF